jgi:predicted  nucleic acid-binding Zn-ribbon protein
MNGLLLLILRVLSVMRQEIRFSRKQIMSAISDFAAKQKAFNERQGAAVDGAVTSLQGLTADVAELNRKIEELQNSSGGVTPEDQVLIDDLQTQGEAVAAKAEALATALKALDDATPPVVPPVP